MPSSSSFLRQLSGTREAWKSTSKRWVGSNISHSHSHSHQGSNKYYCTSELGFWGHCERRLRQMEELQNNMNMYGGGCESGGGLVMRKRVMVVVDDSSHSKHAMMWALTHVANKGDLFTLLHIVPSSSSSSSYSYSHKASERSCDSSSSTSSYSSSSSGSPFLANSLGSLCKACKPEVEVEALVIQGPKLATVISQVKKLEVSVLVLGQKKPSSLISCLCGTSSSEEFVEQCIDTAECLTIGVRKQSRGVSGYLISTRWQKNFWLLA